MIEKDQTIKNNNEIKHIPIMCKEIINIITKHEGKTVLDCTFGGGGHTNALRALGIKVIGLDQDPTTKADIYDKFSNFPQHLQDKVDFILADLGMSSIQLEMFSYKNHLPLDLRLNRESGDPLWVKLKHMSRFEIEKILEQYGEEKSFKKIATNICTFRLKEEIKTNMQLRLAVGIDDFKILSRVFQAFRIYINQEIEELNKLLNEIPNFVCKGALILTFHSIEDRIVKHSFKHFKNNGFLLPTKEEILENSRSRSAKLRWFLK